MFGTPFVIEVSFSRLLNARKWAKDYGKGCQMRSQQFHAPDFTTLDFIEQFQARDAQRFDPMSIRRLIGLPLGRMCSTVLPEQ